VEDDVRNAVELTVEKFETLDVMVNNARIVGPPIPDIRSYDTALFKKVLDVNLNEVFHGMKHAATVMVPCRKGSIISIASSGSIVGGLTPHAYTGSKFAVVGLTKNLAGELGKHGVRVNCVSPFATPTELAFRHLMPGENTDESCEAFLKSVEGNANLKGVYLLPSDVAEAVLFLASDDAKYISGQNLVVDGGFTTVNHTLFK
jgi:xanthoxin dehydrogenase